MERCHVAGRFVALIIILTALAGCSSDWHVWSPDRPENLTADYHRDVFGQWGVYLQWVDTNGSEDIGFTVYRNGEEIAVVDPYCLEWDENLTCTDFRMFTTYFDTGVVRGQTYCYEVSAHYYGLLDDAIFGESGRSSATCISIPVQ